MGIPVSELRLRIVSTETEMDPVKTFHHLTYEVYHAGTGSVVASNKLAQRLTSAANLQAADDALVTRALAEFAEAKWQFGSNAALSGYSPYDVSLILRHWSFEKAGANWDLSHPLSGEFDGVAIAGDPFPAIIDRAAAIVARVLPPPTWVWASSPGAGQLSMRCVAVANADHYAAYQDHGKGSYTLLGEAPTANGGTINVDAGYYVVRMAAVAADDTVGILGHGVGVLVS